MENSQVQVTLIVEENLIVTLLKNNVPLRHFQIKFMPFYSIHEFN